MCGPLFVLSRRLLRLRPVTGDLLPLAAHPDKRIGDDDAVRPSLPLDEKVIGVLVVCDGGVAVDAHLEFGDLFAPCLNAVVVGH